jgi:hypothetical protein
MKKLPLLLLALLLMAFQCDEDELIEDPLMDTGLLGRWEIADETINGITDLLPKCCRFFEFNPDGNPEDLDGLFSFTNETGVFEGAFTLDPENQTIELRREGRAPVTYSYSLNSALDYLEFSFSEGDAEFVQGWQRTE